MRSLAAFSTGWNRGVSLAALIRALFRNGEQGAWLDPSDATTLFQDAAGTTPAGIGDPVRLITDKSGNDHDALAPSDAARPLVVEVDDNIAIRRDLIDDRLDVTLPAITNGKIIIGTTQGVWVDDLNFAGGTFSLGPTTYTGGPAGLYDAIGADELGTIILDRQPTAAELDTVLKWFKSKGAPGRFVLGAELVTNGTFDTDTDWTKGGGWAISGGTATFSGGSGDIGLSQVVNPTADALHLIAVTQTERTAGEAFLRLGGTTNLGSLGTTTGSKAFLVTAESANDSFFVIPISIYRGSVDNISVRPLTVEAF